MESFDADLTLRKAALVPKVPLLRQTGGGHGVAHQGGLPQPQQRDVVGSVRGVVVRVQVLGLYHNRLFPSLALILTMVVKNAKLLLLTPVYHADQEQPHRQSIPLFIQEKNEAFKETRLEF